MADKIVVLNARPDRAGRPADGALQPPRQRIRGGLHRGAGDELSGVCRCRAGRRWPTAVRRWAGRTRRRRSGWASGPNIVILRPAGQGEIAATVTMRETLGGDAYLYVRLAGGRDACRPCRRRHDARPRARSSGWSCPPRACTSSGGWAHPRIGGQPQDDVAELIRDAVARSASVAEVMIGPRRAGRGCGCSMRATLRDQPGPDGRRARLGRGGCRRSRRRWQRQASPRAAM